MIKGIFRLNHKQIRPCNFGVTNDSVILSEEVKTKSGINLVTVTKSAAKYAKDLNLPTSADYTLQNLMASGVPLAELPTNGLIPDDPMSSENVSAGAAAAEELLKQSKQEFINEEIKSE